MRAQATMGALSTSAGQALRVCIQFISVVVLSRLLAPEVFGAMAMMMPVVAFVLMFSDLGLSQATVTAREITPRQMSTLFWVNMILGGALALLVMFSSPFVAQFYGEPGLVFPLMALGLSILLSSAGAQHKALANRTLRFHVLVIVDILALLSGFATSVAIALVHSTVWALVAGTIVTAAVGCAGLWYISDWRPHLALAIGESRSLLHFGRGLAGFNILNFISRNADNVLIGRFTSATQLGYYDRAYKLLLFPLSQINNPVGRVLIPILSRLVDQPERYRQAYLRAVGQLLLFTIPGVGFLITNAEQLVPAVLGPQWVPSIPIFLWLSFAAVHQPLSATTGWLFISQSRTGEFARWGMVVAVTSIGAFAVGLPWGAVGVAAAYGLSDLFIRAPIIWYWVGRRGPVATRDFVQLALPYATALAAIFTVDALLDERTLFSWPFIDLGARWLICYAVAWAAICLWPRGRAALRDLRDTMKSVISR